jgi:hypothetical protein
VLTAAFRTTGHAQESAADTIAALTNQFVAAWNDDIYQQVAHFYGPGAVLVAANGRVLQGRDAIVREFLRPNVARMRGMRLGFSKTLGGEARGQGLHRAFSPASTPRRRCFNTWAASRWTG